MGRWLWDSKQFLSTLSLRRATLRILLLISCSAFLSTLSLRRATFPVSAHRFDGRISIHALLAESDFPAVGKRLRSTYFYPRSPCGERLRLAGTTSAPNKFLSTLSLRRATQDVRGPQACACDFYPRSPCGERQEKSLVVSRPLRISIHALLAESDMIAWSPDRQTRAFLSTLSLRRATASTTPFSDDPEDFYPRSPCGERLAVADLGKRNIWISIHALLAESDDLNDKLVHFHVMDFYPRSPCGERLHEALHRGRLLPISIHALLAESDPRIALMVGNPPAFLSTLSLRRATLCTYIQRYQDPYFYPRSPCGERHVACGYWHKLRHFYPRSPCGERQMQRSETQR